MKRLADFRRFSFVILLVLLTANLWGQVALSGTGTENDPYRISEKADWNKFAQAVNDGHSFAGEYLILETSDITITISSTSTDKMAGVMTNPNNTLTEDKWFSGTFDGNGNTLTFNVGTLTEGFNSGNDYSPNAPFRVIDGATIKNLTVEGAIYSVRRYSAGFVGFAYNAKTSKVNNIINCTSNIFFYGKFIDNGGSGTGIGNRRYDCSAAGFVAENKTGKIYFNKCMFDGEIVKGGDNYANRGAGFVSYNNGGTAYFTNCAMAGTIGLDYAGTFYRASDIKHEYSNCYYITRPANQNQEQFDGTNCKQAYTDATIGTLSNEIYKKYVINSTNYYIPSADIIGLETTTYSYTGNDITITPDVTYYGRTLTKDTDYVINYEKKNGDVWESVSVINAAGDYRIKISGTGFYAGSYTSSTIHVVSYNTWAAVKAILADDSEGDRNITLSANITADVTDPTNTALVVNGSVILNLNGRTIDRGLADVDWYGQVVPSHDPDYNGLGQVIYINSGASLTINGSGTITGGYHKGSGDNIDGGGIYNKGTLIMNNVTVMGNICEKQDGNGFSGRGGGIVIGSSGSLTMTNCTVTCNKAQGGGGGIFGNEAVSFTINGGYISANVTQDKGAGARVIIPSNKTYNITGCTFYGNSATDQKNSEGGGLYLSGASNSLLNLTNCTFEMNTAMSKGGGFFSIKGTTYATNCIMTDNLTYDEAGVVNDKSYGGSIYLHASRSDISTYTMDGGKIDKSRTITDGGAVYIASGAVFNVLGNVQIKDCYAPTDDSPNVSNNTYLQGAAKIHVVGPLGPDAMICIANNNSTGTFMEVDQSLSPAVIADIQAHFAEHFTLDNTDYNMVYDGSNFVIYEPYSWTNTETWSNSAISSATDLSEGLPTASSVITLKRAVKIPRDCVAIANSISFTEAGELIIEEGGQLLYNTSIEAKIVKDIAKAPSYEEGWYTISSSVHDKNSTTESLDNVENIKSQFYDLFAYDEPTHYWINQKNEGAAGFTTFTKGRGYIYRRTNEMKIKFAGETNVGSIDYNVTYTPSAGTLKGFNLIGNPYAHNITLKYTTLKNSSDVALPAVSQLTGYYVLNDSGGWGTELGVTDEIAPAQGFLVQVPSTAAKVNFQQTAQRDRANNDFMRFAISNDEYEDVAYALFAKGLGLNKIGHRNPEIPMVYIDQNEQDYAIATMSDETKAFNLNFEAKTTGRYTLSLKTEGEFNYIHIIDKVAEEDIDMLAEGEYSFIGSPADMADRFVVRLTYLPDYSDEDNDNFAYQSGNEVLVSGEGTLQVFNVMGRLVMQKHVNGVETVCTSSVPTGVYILRLNENTQKIIIK